MPIFSFPQRPSSKFDNYVCRGTLDGHFGAIVALGATDDGKLLASGAADGTKVWDLETMTQLGCPSSSAIRGATTAITWIKRDDDPGEALSYGTQGGYLVCWRQGAGIQDFEEVSCCRLTHPGEITGLAFDPSSNRGAVCNRNGVVQVHALDNSMNMRPLYSISISNTSPKAIAFGAVHGSERDILVFGLYDGIIKILRGSGAVAESWDLGSYIGNAVVDSRKKSMCIDDPSSGVNVHRLEDNGQSKVKSFPIPVKKKMRPRGVCYVNQCSEIVSGSDHGVVYVFDRRSGEIVDELRIDPEEWVQTVAGTDYNGVPTILAAKSRDVDAPNVIYVWRKKNKTRLVGTVALSESWRIVEVGMVVLVIIAMFWQNIASMSSQWIFGQV
ncbi:WD40-repeat-containing domain protein [Mycena polygramma]|nr:WD40-repeat-containing domain protein [Mycena polygramma]KAJ7668607.1 WD40-repeat-containing domain protein [Mycena polygramma]